MMLKDRFYFLHHLDALHDDRQVALLEDDVTGGACRQHPNPVDAVEHIAHFEQLSVSLREPLHFDARVALLEIDPDPRVRILLDIHHTERCVATQKHGVFRTKKKMDDFFFRQGRALFFVRHTDNVKAQTRNLVSSRETGESSNERKKTTVPTQNVQFSPLHRHER